MVDGIGWDVDKTLLKSDLGAPARIGMAFQLTTRFRPVALAAYKASSARPTRLAMAHRSPPSEAIAMLIVIRPPSGSQVATSVTASRIRSASFCTSGSTGHEPAYMIRAVTIA